MKPRLTGKLKDGMTCTYSDVIRAVKAINRVTKTKPAR